PRIDLHPDGRLHAVYSGKSFDPREIMAADRALDAQLEERANELLRNESALGREALVRELDLFEASLRFNCEHVVPQSWFNKRLPMKADLHHLYASEPGCNSFRSNIPYFDFDDFEETVRTACGKRESQGFEPLTNKGAAARSTLYFLLRYPGAISKSSFRVDARRLKTLLAWHKAFPPHASTWELHRNWTIAEAQGNRNPLIDFPEIGDKIDFKLGLG
ncbi:MAG: endonuclease, partial [Acidobacteriota bacterium]